MRSHRAEQLAWTEIARTEAAEAHEPFQEPIVLHERIKLTEAPCHVVATTEADVLLAQ